MSEVEPSRYAEEKRGRIKRERCYRCGRFVRPDEGAFTVEYGDYGTVHSAEAACPRCHAAFDALGCPSAEPSAGEGQAPANLPRASEDNRGAAAP
jgi:ribosomal protein S27AE